jgi:hypothetical protein
LAKAKTALNKKTQSLKDSQRALSSLKVECEQMQSEADEVKQQQDCFDEQNLKAELDALEDDILNIKARTALSFAI